MALLGGSLREPSVVAVNTGYSVTIQDHNCILDVTATGSAVSVSLAAAATLPNGFRVVVHRNSASNANVTVGAPIGLTLSTAEETLELACDGAAWKILTRGATSSGGYPPDNATLDTVDISGTTYMRIKPIATAVGQVMISLDGSTVVPRMPIIDPEVGWLVDEISGLLIVD